MEDFGTENFYMDLKNKSKDLIKRILATKSIYEKKGSSKNKEYLKKVKVKNIFPKEYYNWYNKSFKTYINNNFFECPIISDEEWAKNEINHKSSIELRNLIFKLNNEIYYEYFDNIINAEILLKGESKFWIFLHCEEKINDKTAVIIVSKQEFSKRCYVSLGSFINKKNYNNKNEKNSLFESMTDTSRLMNISSNGIYNIDNNIDLNDNNNYNNNFSIINNEESNEYEFIVFKIQELVEEISLKDKKEKKKKEVLNNDNNKSRLNIKIFDDGQTIIVKIILNDGSYENEIKGDFFIPAFNIENLKNFKENKNSNGFKIMIAGSGEGCGVILFSNEINYKSKKNYYNKYRNDCQCCIIN